MTTKDTVTGHKDIRSVFSRLLHLPDDLSCGNPAYHAEGLFHYDRNVPYLYDGNCSHSYQGTITFKKAGGVAISFSKKRTA